MSVLLDEMRTIIIFFMIKSSHPRRPDEPAPGAGASDVEVLARANRSPMPIRRIESSELLDNAGELIIIHAGREYRLRVTANGKLILTA
jgi:hemin uptake protein HemP